MLQHFVSAKVSESSGDQISLHFPAKHTLSSLWIPGFCVRRCKRLSTFMWQVRHQRRQRGAGWDGAGVGRGLWWDSCPGEGYARQPRMCHNLKLSTNEIWAAAFPAARQLQTCKVMQEQIPKMASNPAILQFGWESEKRVLALIPTGSQLAEVCPSPVTRLMRVGSGGLKSCVLNVRSSDCLIRGRGPGHASIHRLGSKLCLRAKSPRRIAHQ